MLLYCIVFKLYKFSGYKKLQFLKINKKINYFKVTIFVFLYFRVLNLNKVDCQLEVICHGWGYKPNSKDKLYVHKDKIHILL